MGGRGHEDGQAKLFGHDVQAGDVVGVLVGDEDGGERLGRDALGGEAAAGFAAGEAAVDEHARLRGCKDRAVASAAGG